MLYIQGHFWTEENHEDEDTSWRQACEASNRSLNVARTLWWNMFLKVAKPMQHLMKAEFTLRNRWIESLKLSFLLCGFHYCNQPLTTFSYLCPDICTMISTVIQLQGKKKSYGWSHGLGNSGYFSTQTQPTLALHLCYRAQPFSKVPWEEFNSLQKTATFSFSHLVSIYLNGKPAFAVPRKKKKTHKNHKTMLKIDPSEKVNKNDRLSLSSSDFFLIPLSLPSPLLATVGCCLLWGCLNVALVLIKVIFCPRAVNHGDFQGLWKKEDRNGT